VTPKTSKAKPRPSNSLKVKAGPTAMQKVLRQNLHKIVIYENKPRPAARDRSQCTFGFELLALPSLALFFD